MTHIAVIGAGAWGTALAIHAARTGARVTLWARRPLALDADGANPRLAGYPLGTAIRVTTDLPVRADLCLVAAPMQHLRAVLTALPDSGPLVLCCKGVERGTLALPLQIAAETHPGQVRAMLSGPNFAHEIARGLPAASVLAAEDAALARGLADLLAGPTLRLYASDDPLGVQIGGAAKNVIAIAAGVTIGARLGENARAALITRGVAEIARLAEAMGGKAATLAGLAGLGDLILTCTGAGSRNFSLGVALGQGEALDDILARRTTVAEGVDTAPALLALAERHGVITPVIETVTALLAGTLSPEEARDALMARPVGYE